MPRSAKRCGAAPPRPTSPPSRPRCSTKSNRDPARLVGREGSECRPGWTVPQQGQDVSAVLVSVRVLITDVPSPGSHHGKHESPALLEQDLIDIRVMRADLVGCVRDVELDRPTAARLEVDEERAVRRVEDVAWVRFAVQQLFGSSTGVDVLTG